MQILGIWAIITFLSGKLNSFLVQTRDYYNIQSALADFRYEKCF